MPTITEILAAKKAAAATAVAAGQPVTYANAVPAAPKKTLAQAAAEKIEDADLLKRLTPPTLGKSLVLSKELPADHPNGEPRGQMTPIKGPDDIRSLGETEGEALPLAPLAADKCIKDWHKALTAFETELVIMNDPVDPERAWLAVRMEEEPMNPLLLKALPFYEHPRTVRPASEPF
jgi:hypothetical protein